MTAITPLGQKIEQKREFDRNNTTWSFFSAEMISITPLGQKSVRCYSRPPVEKIENNFFSRQQVTENYIRL